jgi:tRNA pseudouridine38-40 synthase
MVNKRYFAELSYLGTHFSGWQKQPKSSSVQEVIEKAISKILRTKTEVVGCGRTDAGVHAKQYFLHFDFEGDFPEGFTNRLNKVLPPDIAFKKFIETRPNAHARFDATHRAYEYHLGFHKNPFTTNTAFHFPFAHQLDHEKMQQAATLLLKYKAFFPFCKSNSDAKTMNCDLQRAEWVFDDKNEKLVFHISANRFLRGMVRLIVGMCLNVGLGKVSLEQIKEALDNQTRLSKSYSVPPQGLFLTDIRYPSEV